jgi:hypothetical protein
VQQQFAGGPVIPERVHDSEHVFPGLSQRMPLILLDPIATVNHVVGVGLDDVSRVPPLHLDDEDADQTDYSVIAAE